MVVFTESSPVNCKLHRELVSSRCLKKTPLWLNIFLILLCFCVDALLVSINYPLDNVANTSSINEFMLCSLYPNLIFIPTHPYIWQLRVLPPISKQGFLGALPSSSTHDTNLTNYITLILVILILYPYLHVTKYIMTLLKRKV